MSDKIENNENNGRVKVGIPKGSLEDATIELFRKAGWRINRGSRNYFPTVDDEDLSFSLVRAQEIALSRRASWMRVSPAVTGSSRTIPKLPGSRS
jgi:ATP phosphoribosyltransferase